MYEPTDDLGLSPEFLADEDIARDEDNYGRARRCTCGRLAALDAFSEYAQAGDRFDGAAFAGCRGCDPVDHECKPYGFGIERFEDPALAEANREVAGRWFGGPYRSLQGVGYVGPRGGRYAGNGRILELRNEIWAHRTRQSKRRERHSRHVWERLCGECETHREAVRRYKAWARRAVTVPYRDEAPAALRHLEAPAAAVESNVA